MLVLFSIFIVYQHCVVLNNIYTLRQYKWILNVYAKLKWSCIERGQRSHAKFIMCSWSYAHVWNIFFLLSKSSSLGINYSHFFFFLIERCLDEFSFGDSPSVRESLKIQWALTKLLINHGSKRSHADNISWTHDFVNSVLLSQPSLVTHT